MPSTYRLTRPAMDSNRIQKVSKKVLDECKEDRELALQAYRYFKNMVDENPQDASAKSNMVDCLKLAQSSKNQVVKIVDLLIKLEAVKDGSKNSESSLFNELSNMMK